MRHITEEITGFNGGGFSSQWTLNMDVGPVYKEIILATNLDNDQLTQIQVTLNGDTIYDVSGEELRMLEAYKNRAQQNGRFVIPFSDMSCKTADGQDLSELVTLSGDNLTLTVKTAAATATQITNSLVPTLYGVAVMGAAKASRITIPRMVSELVQAGKTGKNVFKNFNRGPRIRRMHINSANVTELEIKRDKLTRYHVKKADNDYLLEREGLSVQAGYFHFDPIRTKFAINDFLQTAGSSFEINPFVSSAGDLNTLFETVETV